MEDKREQNQYTPNTIAGLGRAIVSSNRQLQFSNNIRDIDNPHIEITRGNDRFIVSVQKDGDFDCSYSLLCDYNNRYIRIGTATGDTEIKQEEEEQQFTVKNVPANDNGAVILQLLRMVVSDSSLDPDNFSSKIATIQGRVDNGETPEIGKEHDQLSSSVLAFKDYSTNPSSEEDPQSSWNCNCFSSLFQLYQDLGTGSKASVLLGGALLLGGIGCFGASAALPNPILPLVGAALCSAGALLIIATFALDALTRCCCPSRKGSGYVALQDEDEENSLLTKYESF